MTILLDIKPIIKKSYKGLVFYEKNPMDELYRKGLITKVGNGIFVIEGILANIINIIDKSILQIAEKTRATHVFVPSNMSMENAIRSHHLQSFRDQAIMLSKYNKKGNKIKGGKANIEAADYEGLASPAVCYHYFSSMKEKKILKNCSITCISKCSRKEMGELNDLSRLENFTMREIVFLGTERYCLGQREKILDETTRMLHSIFDLSFDIVTAADPFFGKDANIKSKAQLALESKYEAQALLPYNNKTLAIASFNFHGQIFYDRFNIKSGNQKIRYSGCAAWGYERILYAIISQKGTNFSDKYYKKILKIK